MSGSGRRAALVKLGGSLITVKGEDARARPEVLERLARQLEAGRRELDGPLVVGHGAGSFGHPPADRYGLRDGLGAPDARRGLSLTQRRAAELHALVTRFLREAGLPVFSIVASSAAVAEGGEVVDFAAEPVALALREGMVPVLYGDVMMDRRQGAAIASTEDLFVRLAGQLPDRGWGVDRVLWLGDTEGVYGRDGGVISEIRAEPGVEVPSAGEAAETDVTGGMAHRVDAAVRLARKGVPSWIGTASGERLLRALRGDEAEGTRVVPPA